VSGSRAQDARFADRGIRYSLLELVPPRGADGPPAEHERK
jgi:hypothetical protein